MKPTVIHMSPDVETKPVLFSRKAGELQLSGTDLVALLKSVLDKGVPFRFQAKGFSMSPFIKDGDVITVSPLSGALPRLSDVVAFIHPKTGRLVVHRMVGKKDNYFIVKGDNISDSDDLISRTNILGSVIKVERDGKKVFLGYGQERFLIAFLTRRGLLYPFLYPIWRIMRPFVRRLTP